MKHIILLILTTFIVNVTFSQDYNWNDLKEPGRKRHFNQLKKDIKKYKTDIAKYEKSNLLLNKRIHELNADVKRLNDTIDVKNTEIFILSGNIKIEKDGSKQLKELIIAKDKSISALNAKIIAKDKSISALNAKIIAKDKSISTLNGKIIVKDKRISVLESKIIAKDKSIVTLSTGNSNLSEEKIKLKAALTDMLKISVNNLVVGRSYNSKTIQDLIDKCNKYSAFVGKGITTPLITKLNKYKKISVAIIKAKDVLNKKYNKIELDKAIVLLKSVTTIASVKQKADINTYKSLLTKYCSITDEAIYTYNIAHEDRRNNPTECKKTLRLAISRTHPYYTYIIKEFQKKKTNTAYVCKFSKCK